MCRAAPVLIMRRSKKSTKFCSNPIWQKHSCTFCLACSVDLSQWIFLSTGLVCPMYHLLPLFQKENLPLCYFLTAFLKRKSCEPPSCMTSVDLTVDGTGHRRQFAHPLDLLIYLLHVHFPVRQPLTGESCSGTEMLYILGLVLRALFQSVKGHEHKVSWCKYSVKPSI